MRRKLILLLLLCLALTGVVSAEDWDFSYNGVVEDSQMEQTITAPETTLQKEKGYVSVSNDCWYDYSRHSFVYETGSGEIFSSVAYGMATCEEVNIKLTGGGTAYLYQDGNQVESGSEFTVSEPGAYVLSITSNGMPREPLKFTLLDGVSGKLSQYSLPAGFYFDKVSVNGELTPWNGGTLDMSREGEYRIEYVCNATGISYLLALTVDHTPPSLALEAVKDGEARGPVDLSDLEPGAKISITRNGDPVSYSTTLTNSGRYEVTVSDQAGNVQSYNFTIRTYFNGSAIGFLLLLIAMLAGLCGYLVYSRRNLRVR